MVTRSTEFILCLEVAFRNPLISLLLKFEELWITSLCGNIFRAS
jgi:hypothetical protein